MEMQEQLIRKVNPTGNGAHVFIPREWIGEEVIIVRTLKGDVGERILEAVSDYLDKIVGVYLFGSCARGENTKESDIDLLVISNEKIKIEKKGFEIVCLTLNDFEKALKISPLLLYGALAEAKTVINSSLLKSLKQKYKISYREIKEYIKETKNIIEINKEILNFYSLILRLRGIFIINSLLENKIARNSDFKKWILGNVRINFNEVFDYYNKYKRGKKTRNVNENDLIKLLDFLESEIDKLEKKMNDKKRKKT